MLKKISHAILLCLLAAKGEPLEESTLVRAVQTFMRPEQPSVGDVLAALKDVDDAKLASGVSDPDNIEERSWTLTTKGTHKARQLR